MPRGRGPVNESPSQAGSRAYLHKVVHCIVHGWSQDTLRELLPDRMLAAHPELFVGDPDALPIPKTPRPLPM
jgi:hypothetical protein